MKNLWDLENKNNRDLYKNILFESNKEVEEATPFKTRDELIDFVKEKNPEILIAKDGTANGKQIFYYMPQQDLLKTALSIEDIIGKDYNFSGFKLHGSAKASKAGGEDEKDLSTNAQEAIQAIIISNVLTGEINRFVSGDTLNLEEYLNHYKASGTFTKEVQKEIYTDKGISIPESWKKAFSFLVQSNFSEIPNKKYLTVSPGLSSQPELVKLLFTSFKNIGIQYKDKNNPADVYLINRDKLDPTDWTLNLALGDGGSLLNFRELMTFNSEKPSPNMKNLIDQLRLFNKGKKHKIKLVHIYCEFINSLIDDGILIPLSLKKLTKPGNIVFKVSKVNRGITETTLSQIYLNNILREDSTLFIDEHKDRDFNIKRSFNNFKIRLPDKSFSGGLDENGENAKGNAKAFLYFYSEKDSITQDKTANSFEFKRQNGFSTNLAIETMKSEIKGARAGKATSVFSEALNIDDTESLWFLAKSSSFKDGSMEQYKEMQKEIKHFCLYEGSDFIINKTAIDKWKNFAKHGLLTKENKVHGDYTKNYNTGVRLQDEDEPFSYLLGDGLANLYCLVYIVKKVLEKAQTDNRNFMDILITVLASAAIVPLVDLSKVVDDISSGYIDGVYPMANHFGVYDNL